MDFSIRFFSATLVLFAAVGTVLSCNDVNVFFTMLKTFVCGQLPSGHSAKKCLLLFDSFKLICILVQISLKVIIYLIEVTNTRGSASQFSANHYPTTSHCQFFFK
jgi:hypothetical protein